MKVLDAKKYCILLGIFWVALALIELVSPIVRFMDWEGNSASVAIVRLEWKSWVSYFLKLVVAISYFLPFISLRKLRYFHIGVLIALAVVSMFGLRVFITTTPFSMLLSAIGYTLYAIYFLIPKLPRWTVFIPAVVHLGAMVIKELNPLGFALSSFVLGVMRVFLYFAYSFFIAYGKDKE